jgi:hypothetical protein
LGLDIVDNNAVKYRIIRNRILVTSTVILFAVIVLYPDTLLWGQCQKWEYSYSPEIRCDYLEYFGLPRQAAQICLARQNSKNAPGDYYQEPNPDHFLMINKTKSDIDKFDNYLRQFLKTEYVCDFPANLFDVYLIFSDTTIRMGQYARQVSYPDSSRREFFGKFTVENNLVFMSGWFDKFVCLYVNIECDSIETALAKAGAILKFTPPPLAQYIKSVFEMKRSDVDLIDSLTSEEEVKSETRQSEFYRAIDSTGLVWHLFRKNVALMAGPNPESQTVTGVKQYWVISVTSYLDKQYMPPWIAPPKK